MIGRAPHRVQLSLFGLELFALHDGGGDLALNVTQSNELCIWYAALSSACGVATMRAMALDGDFGGVG